jgi:hypothetical protein
MRTVYVQPGETAEPRADELQFLDPWQIAGYKAYSFVNDEDFCRSPAERDMVRKRNRQKKLKTRYNWGSDDAGGTGSATD